MPCLPWRPQAPHTQSRGFFPGSPYRSQLWAPSPFALTSVCITFMVRFRSKLSKWKSSVLGSQLMKTDLIFIQFPKLLTQKMLSSAPFFFRSLHPQKYYLRNHKTMGETTHWDCKQHITLHRSMPHLNIASFCAPSFKSGPCIVRHFIITRN